jgi:hypothetical protein
MKSVRACLTVAWLAAVSGCGSSEPATTGAGSSASGAPSPPPSAGPSAKPVASPPSAQASASAAAEPPPPYAGTLTIAMIMGADHVANPFDPWDEALAKLDKKVGKPTATHEANFCWAAVEGDKCASFCIEKTDFTKLKREGKKGPAVGSTGNPQTVGADMDTAFKYCKGFAKK